MNYFSSPSSPNVGTPVKGKRLSSVLQLSSTPTGNCKSPRKSDFSQRLQFSDSENTIQTQKGSLSGDRFIADRNSIDFDLCNHLLNTDPKPLTTSSKYNDTVQTLLSPNSKKRILSYSENEKDCVTEVGSLRLLKQDSESDICKSPKKSMYRNLPNGPNKILDAPDIVDDYYLNLLDWSKQNVVAIALKQSLYMWNASTGHIDQLMSVDNDSYICSLKWSNDATNTLAIGSSSNTVQLWDSSTMQMIREMTGHSGRVSSLSWNSNIISSGGRDSIILNHDVRQRNNVVSKYSHHTQEVCGLQWSPDGSTLASGGNENLLCLWDAAMSSNSIAPLRSNNTYSPRFAINEHQAAVKAISWCPWQRNVLASGGGTADRTIRLWNSNLGTNIKVIDTGSQVCSIVWNSVHKEIISSHGFSDNQLILWNSHNLSKIKEFRGHSSRVLFLAMSPDESTVCSASADETLRFWEIFGNRGKSSSCSPNSPCKSTMLGSSNNNFNMSLR